MPFLSDTLTDEEMFGAKKQKAPDTLTDKEMNLQIPNVLNDEEMNAQDFSVRLIRRYIAEEKKGIADKVAEGFDEAMTGAIATAIKSPQIFAGLVQEAGESGIFSDIKLLGLPLNQLRGIAQKIKKGERRELTDIDKAVVQTSQDIVEANKRFVSKHFPDIEPSGEGGVKDFMYNLGSGATTLGAALGISVLTHSPHAAAIMFGLYQKGGIYQQARKAELSPEKASGLSTLAGGVEGALEYVGLDFMLKKYGRQLFTMFIRMGTEASQEFSQEVGENIIVKLGGIDKTRGIFQGAGQSALIGAILGVPASVSIDIAEQTGIIKELKESGFTEKEAKQLLENIIKKQKEQISKVIKSEAGFARMAAEEPAKPKEDILDRAIAKKALKEPLTVEEQKAFEKAEAKREEAKIKPKTIQARQKQLESEVKNIDKQMRTLEETKIRLEKQGLKTGKIDRQLDELSKKYIYAESSLAEMIIGQPRLEELKREIGQMRIVDIVKEETRIEKEAQRLGKKAGIKEQKVHQREMEFRRRERNKAKSEVKRLVSSINRISEAKMDLGYKDQIDTLLVKYDFKRRTARTMARRESMGEFIERQKAQGEQIFIPDEQLALLDKKTLNDISLEDLRSIYQTIGYLSHFGKLKKNLIAGKKLRNFRETENNMTQRIYQTGKKEPSLPPELKTPSMRKRSFIGKITNAIDAFAAHQRKTEFICRVLDGFKEGINQENIIEPIQEAYNQEALKQLDIFTKLAEIMQPIHEDFKIITNRQYDIEGISQTLTKQEAMAVYANSKSPINKEYGLIKGWGWSEKQINNIINSLTATEKAFVNNCMKLIDSLFPETIKIAEKLTGQRPPKRIGYWPKKTDKEISTLATLRQRQQDLFQDVINATYVERGFTKEIGKIAEPVSLNYFGVLLDHINKVIHFQTHALAVRDAQKLIHSPKIKQGITDVLGENIYKQFAPWLREVANPKIGYIDTIDKLAGWLKRNSTATILGLKLSVSLKQFGSYTQTIHEIGAIPALKGFMEFYAHPFKNIQFIYEKSPQMRFRRKTFDREVREWMESKEIRELVAGKPGLADMIYSLIKTVDKAATLPTWYSAYHKNYNRHKNKNRAIKYADGVVRRTQPAGHRKDLAAIMRGPNVKKLFTMFYTHFSNVYNQIANETAKLKLGEKALPLRIVDNLVAWWWLLIVPGLLGEQIRRLGKSRGRNLIKGIASYGLSSIAIIGNFANSLLYKEFDYYPSPAFGFPREVQKIFKVKKPRTKLKYATRSLGYITGLPMQQTWITLSGIFDLWTGQTEDLRRLGFSEWTLKEEEKKKGEFGSFKRTTKLKGNFGNF